MEKGGKVGKSAKSWKYGEKLEKGENVGNSGSKVIYAGGGYPIGSWVIGQYRVTALCWHWIGSRSRFMRKRQSSYETLVCTYKRKFLVQWNYLLTAEVIRCRDVSRPSGIRAPAKRTQGLLRRGTTSGLHTNIAFCLEWDSGNSMWVRGT